MFENKERNLSQSLATRPSLEIRYRACSLLSVIIPCFNEELVIFDMHRRLVATLETIPKCDAFELIYIDDGSHDSTLNHLREIQRADPRVRVLRLTRNFGQVMAITAGLDEATGDAVVLIDADLQDPPEIIAEMLERWCRGADVVYGLRLKREGETIFKRWPAAAFYRFMAWSADISIPLDAGNFRLIDRSVVDLFLTMPERDRYLPGMVAWIGSRQEPVYYHRMPRAAGESKWSVIMLLNLAVDSILSFSLAPLRLAIWLGFLSAGSALLGIVYALVVRLLTDVWITGWATLFIAILFFGGVHLLIIGIFGEYLGRIYNEVKRRPLYLVKERLGFTTRADGM